VSAIVRISLKMAQDDDQFEIRPGRIRSKGGGKARMQSKMLARTARLGGNPRRVGDPSAGVSSSAPRTGRFNARGRGAKFAAAFSRDAGWSFDSRSGGRVRARRVAVKARVVKLAGKAVAVGPHLRYLERDGVSRDGEPGRFYSTFSDEADGKEFAERGAGDRHQFRFIVSPEDGAKFNTLKTATRDLMARMEQDLGTNLDWIAVDHFDTGHPHAHILVRGVTEDGKTLNIAGDYIAHGIRHRASEIMTRALGPQSELELREQMIHEVGAERMTRLDRAIIRRAEGNVLDLRQGPAWDSDHSFQQLLIGRARQLERMELAEPTGKLTWSLAPDLEKTLTDLGRRGDIIRTMHKAMGMLPQDRGLTLPAIHDPARDREPIIGQVVQRGAAGDHHDRRYLIVDGIDGRTHYVDIGGDDQPIGRGSLIKLEPRPIVPRKSDLTTAEVADANGGRYSVDIHLAHDRNASEEYAQTHVRRLEAIRRATGAVERLPDGSWKIAPDHLDRVREYERGVASRSPVTITTLAAVPLEKQATLDVPTWLDKELVSGEPLKLAAHGFGKDLNSALYLRQQWLVDQQLAEVDGDRFRFRPGAMDTLRQREIRTLASQLSKEMRMGVREAAKGERVDGIYRRSVEGGSSRFALIEQSREFVLVPWRPDMERHLGKQISGIPQGDSMSWSIGRGRSGPSIGM
jgi:type IV secretory pathway VirD2 relaxase